MTSKRSVSATPPAARRPVNFARVLCAALFVVALVGAAQAQSGRRVVREKEIAPVPTPVPSPEAKKPVQEATKKIPLVVLADNTGAMQASATTQSIVTQAFGLRLREARAFEINADSTRAPRGEASRKAKGETERFVVWIALRARGMDDGQMGMGRPNPENYIIEYAVFDPVTGKSRGSGIVYPRPARGGIGGVLGGSPSCYPTTYAYEFEFVYAAIDAANRVMKSFNLVPPPVCGG